MDSIQRTEKKQRIFYFDVIRAIACLAVVMVHVSGPLLESAPDSIDFWVGNIFNSISRVCIPFFVMISGALFLDEDYCYCNKKMRDHILKMILFFVFWSAVYCIVFDVVVPLASHEEIRIGTVIVNLIRGHFHLWFVYMIIGLYLTVPLLRLWVKKSNSAYIRYFILISSVLVFLLPQLIDTGRIFFDEIAEIRSSVDYLKNISCFPVYFILGWYLNNFEIKHKKKMTVCGAAGIAIMIGMTYFLSVRTGEGIEYYSEYYLTTLAYSVMGFVLVKDSFKAENNDDSLFSRIVKTISKYSLGIYASHVAVLNVVFFVLRKFSLTNALIWIPLCFISSLIISLIISAVFRKIPFLKHTV
ncbi:MAG: acyltransferase family protein [Clostridia bacterium]|nr:acyltransferase family protein [Clostridia bacterium]